MTISEHSDDVQQQNMECQGHHSMHFRFRHSPTTVEASALFSQLLSSWCSMGHRGVQSRDIRGCDHLAQPCATLAVRSGHILQDTRPVIPVHNRFAHCSVLATGHG